MDKQAFFWKIMAGELPPPGAAATLGIVISFHRSAAVGALTGKGRVVKRGRDICFLAGELYQQGELVASAAATAIVRSTPQ